MRRMKLVALLTDYGLGDHYVGVVKGVIKGVSPSTDIVDITNFVPHFDIATGAFLLLQASKYLPKGCVVLAVVDPGVGTRRRESDAKEKTRTARGYQGPLDKTTRRMAHRATISRVLGSVLARAFSL